MKTSGRTRGGFCRADLERVGDDGADLLLAAHRRVASG
jgi:hypothetical protein